MTVQEIQGGGGIRCQFYCQILPPELRPCEIYITLMGPVDCVWAKKELFSGPLKSVNSEIIKQEQSKVADVEMRKMCLENRLLCRFFSFCLTYFVPPRIQYVFVSKIFWDLLLSRREAGYTCCLQLCIIIVVSTISSDIQDWECGSTGWCCRWKALTKNSLFKKVLLLLV